MSNKLKNLFKNLENIESSPDLEARILRKVAAEKRWQFQKRLIFADTLALGSGGFFVFAMFNFWNGVINSEFWSLAKLIFTDAGAVADHWTNFSFSLLETFPAGHLAVVLAPILLLFFSSLMYFSSNMNNKYNHIT